MGDIFSPKAMPTGQQRGNDILSGILGQYMGGGARGGVAGLNLPPNASINDMMGALQNAGRGQGPGQMPGTLGEWVQNTFALPGYGGQMTAGMNPLQEMSQQRGTQAMSEFFQPGGAWETIRNRATEELASGGGMSIQDVYRNLDESRRQGMTRDLGQLEEEFGVAGLSDSTSLYESAARTQRESEQNLLAEVSRIAPQLLEATTGRTTALSNLLAGLPFEVATAGFNLGEGARSIQDLDLQRLYADFLRTQSLFPQILNYFGASGPVDYAPSPFNQLVQGAATGAAIAGGL